MIIGVCGKSSSGKSFLASKLCERLNGFPDDWTNTMNDRMRYFCMGNALVTGVIERIGKRIKTIVD